MFIVYVLLYYLLRLFTTVFLVNTNPNVMRCHGGGLPSFLTQKGNSESCMAEMCLHHTAVCLTILN